MKNVSGPFFCKEQNSSIITHKNDIQLLIFIL